MFQETSFNKFRTKDDITEWLIRYWQLCSGNFYPRNSSFGKYYEISNKNTNLLKAIKYSKYKLICLNDSNIDIDFEKAKNEINKGFKETFYKKSSFEI